MAEEQKSAMPNFSGSYKHDNSENFEAFLEKAGMGFIKRKAASKASPTMDMHHNENSLTIKMTLAIITKEENFEIGEEFEATQVDGYKYKAVANWEGKKLVVKYTPKEAKGIEQSATREFVDDECTKMCVTLQAGDVVAKRFFSKKK